ncbi:glycoside hydrolase family 2 [Sphingobacterium sp. UT-1RO-CII-1]|uniref:sugar-binding domain-containing protein n=1 Tax=Sphingobacterium sp. UT-1RO-CII-1 TaxID=2995225 RepID=UPI00227C46AB|nr:sugar-binding domain-containing protein [Sphingobacterium sp. UT-1RO-CII-1]MCY4780415.1 glycoside hydrolase family 2 [Sphingobacterium sp. UT-1RO-CII-1]
MKNIVLLLLLLSTIFSAKGQEILDLSGSWTVALDSLDQGQHSGWLNKKFSQSIHLPGTTDGAGLGVRNELLPALQRPQLSHLTRKNRYVGAAWYERSIRLPKDWKNKKYILKLERVLWKTDVWIDGVPINQSANSLISPHYFDLTDYLKVGQEHRITLRIDNRKFFDLSYDNMGHAYTDHTQIIWNGVIGEMCIEALPAIHFTDVQVFPDLASKTIRVKAIIENNNAKAIKENIVINVFDKGARSETEGYSKSVVLQPNENIVDFTYNMPGDVHGWDEFSPHLYTLLISLSKQDALKGRAIDFGFRDFSAKGKTFELNDKPVFLRGTLECNIFPLTGHPPMDRKGWLDVFTKAKEWGLNHIRFHSWCPPKGAFEAADELGVYLQAELPIWALNIGEHRSTVDFLYEEAKHMIREYGNHPSFMMWALGNELQGDMHVLNKMVDSLKRMDNRHLYANTAYTFERGHGDRPEYNDDFLITQRTVDGWVRGQGVFNTQSPSFNTNYKNSVASTNVPIVTHEIGQYAVYPNLREIEKYTGVLDPLNFKAIKADLLQKNMLQKADDFLMSSGKLAAILYKEEIERALKTQGISGFQLLDLHDFPGQGTALVGLLDAFWDSKGIIDASEFRAFNSPVVPLIEFEKATYLNSEAFEAEVSVSNYGGKKLNNQVIQWWVRDGENSLAEGELVATLDKGLNSQIGDFIVDLKDIKKAEQLTVEIRIKDTEYKNSWNIWVYPALDEVDFGKVKYTRDVNQAVRLLEEGHSVLFNPDWKKVQGLEGKFVPVFWSPVHFPKQAGTMGLLADPEHPMFSSFPTAGHTDWQWWDLHLNSTTMIIDSLEGGSPLIEMIDNFANNRKLSLAFEGMVGKGKLFVTSIDLHTDLNKRFVAKQLLKSILGYMNSEDFQPAAIRSPWWLGEYFKVSEDQKTMNDPNSIYQ